jgi:divalent metal cation (Fe/Co/Zn/Cd) transporter
MTDTAPAAPVVAGIRECATAVPGVRGVHGLKVRTVGGSYQIQIDIVVDGWITVTAGHEIAVQTVAAVHDAVEGVSNIIVHVDPEDDERA